MAPIFELSLSAVSQASKRLVFWFVFDSQKTAQRSAMMELFKIIFEY